MSQVKPTPKNSKLKVITPELKIPTPSSCLQDVRAYVHTHKYDPQGLHCPVCDKFVKVNYKPMNSNIARSLIWLVLNYHGEWVNVVKSAPRFMVSSHQFSLLHHWDMLETKKHNSGFWRPKQKGIDFVHRRIKAPIGVYFYNNFADSFSSRFIYIDEALDIRFDYEEVMKHPGREHPLEKRLKHV